MGKITINTDSLKEKKEYVRHKVNDGDNVFRILPPFGDASNGYPYRKWTIAWLQDPQTGRKRPYASPFSFGEDACPVFEYVKLLTKKKEVLEAQIKADLANKGLTEDQMKKAVAKETEEFGKILWEIKPKHSYFYNAATKSGVVGLLELKKTAHDGVKKLMAEYIKDYNQDPTSLNSDVEDSGVWINVNRTGQNNDTEYTVSKKQVKVKDPETKKISFEDDQEALPENVVENYQSLAYNLSTLYKQVSYDDLKAILIANLTPLFISNPDLMVPGFEIELPKQSSNDDEEAEELPAPKAVAAKKSTVSIKLDDEDDEDIPAPRAKTVPVVKPQPKKVEIEESLPAPKAKPKAKNALDDDPLAYAEALLSS